MHWPLSFAEVHALEVEHGWDEINEKEADDCPVNIYYVIDIDMHHRDSQTHSYKQSNVDNLRNGYLPFP